MMETTLIQRYTILKKVLRHRQEDKLDIIEYMHVNKWDWSKNENINTW